MSQVDFEDAKNNQNDKFVKHLQKLSKNIDTILYAVIAFTLQVTLELPACEGV